MQNPFEIISTLQIKHRMNVIRHHAPGVQLVSDAIEVLKRTGNDRRIRLVAKDAAAVAFVKVRIEFQTEETIDLGAFGRIHRHPHHLLAFSKKRDRDVLRQ